MKTRMIIEIETPNIINLNISHEDNYDEDGELDEEKERKYREEYSIDLQKYAKSRIDCFLENVFEEEFMDNLEELSIENWDAMEDYGVKIKEIKE